MRNLARIEEVVGLDLTDPRDAWTLRVALAVHRIDAVGLRSGEREAHVVAARDGIDARLYWPGQGEVGADELTLRHLLPLAAIEQHAGPGARLAGGPCKPRRRLMPGTC